MWIVSEVLYIKMVLTVDKNMLSFYHINTFVRFLYITVVVMQLLIKYCTVFLLLSLHEDDRSRPVCLCRPQDGGRSSIFGRSMDGHSTTKLQPNVWSIVTCFDVLTSPATMKEIVTNGKSCLNYVKLRMRKLYISF